jgi:hypothetical protein
MKKGMKDIRGARKAQRRYGDEAKRCIVCGRWHTRRDKTCSEACVSVEGDGVTDPDFLDDPAGIIPGIPGSIRLDNREQLFQESVRAGFSWWRPKRNFAGSIPLLLSAT